MKSKPIQELIFLKNQMEGELLYDELTKAVYATDASVYRILPTAVAYPKSVADIKNLIDFADKNAIELIPRTAGTSLAGQCVGEGIVVDVSRHFTKILSFDKTAKTVTVQPGVIRDELNNFLKPHGLFFGPNTSTANRCMIGGMVGNNSSGTTSIKYGVTRDKVLKMNVLLSDGTEAVFGLTTKAEFFAKTKENSLEGRLYKTIYELLAPADVRKRIKTHFPKPEIHRRNTGYAIDELANTDIFEEDVAMFNMCKLLCGSEGTLAFTTEITLQLDELPPSETLMVAAHFDSLQKCLLAVVPAMKHQLYTCEMMDKVILDCTKENTLYKSYRNFIVEDPEAVLLFELKGNTIEAVEKQAEALITDLENTKLAYAFPVLRGETIHQALELRKAGLGLLGNMVGDKKAVACIEDTAVALEDLEPFIMEFSALMKKYNQKAVYYAHAGAGELHLRPILDLKKETDVVLFRKITTDVAQLVKKYKGSMSGEHGDGIVRSEFIEMLIGKENFSILQSLKNAFDPKSIFNPGKIIAPLPMDKNLRYQANRNEPEVSTLMNFSDDLGILRAAEKCNGSGDCRKGVQAGGTMCPSYRVTKDEKDTTRARANALREFLTNSTKVNQFDHKELKAVFDLCVSCKGCKSECPSNVDVAALKAEFEYQYKKNNGSSLRTKLFVHNHKFNRWAGRAHQLSNFMFTNKIIAPLLKTSVGIAKQRSLPKVHKPILWKEWQRLRKDNKPIKRKVYFFTDEFTEYLDTPIGVDTLTLLMSLGYDVQLIKHAPSGRAYISKGFLEEAKTCADFNVKFFKDLISDEVPLIGLEPSAILTFRDEYLRLASDISAAKQLAKNVLLIDEFIAREIDTGQITEAHFTEYYKTVKLHVHCHQKALASVVDTHKILQLPKNYKVTQIPSGCCGMAGSFGYEKEHYEVSMQMGELTLFPAIRKADSETILVANGTSCRHQILDGTGRVAKHPVTVLLEALKK